MARTEIPDSSELGTFGGVIMIGLGITMIIGTGLAFNGGMIMYGGGIFGITLLGTGVIGIAKAHAKRSTLAKIPALPDDYLALMIAEQPLPFGVCATCRQFDETPSFHGRCHRCDAGSDYHVVEHEPERTLARSSLGIPG